MKTRSLRNEQFFMTGNIYLDAYAKLCGWKASLVYFSLCRHSNKHQMAWPSISTMAKEYNVSRYTIIKGVKTLLEWNIIEMEESHGRHNNYRLLDKTSWEPDPNQSATATSSSQQLVRHSNNTSLPQQPYQSATATPSILRKYTKEVYEELTEEERERNLERMAVLKERLFSKKNFGGGSND